MPSLVNTLNGRHVVTYRQAAAPVIVELDNQLPRSESGRNTYV